MEVEVNCCPITGSVDNVFMVCHIYMILLCTKKTPMSQYAIMWVSPTNTYYFHALNYKLRSY